MEYHLQLLEHKPDEGQNGDCLRTCIACLLDKLPAEVPHFMEGYKVGNLTLPYYEKVNQYLMNYGLVFTDIPVTGEKTLKQILAWAGVHTSGSRYMLTGTSELGFGHIVICKGDRIEHDPSGNGLVAPCFIKGEPSLWWLSFLTKYV